MQKVVFGRHRKFVAFVSTVATSCAYTSPPELTHMIERATLEIQELRDTYHEDKPSVPQDVKDLIDLCRAYRLESLEHRYRCLQLVEYIVHLHCVHGAHGSLETLPPVPPEITWYLDTTAVEC